MEEDFFWFWWDVVGYYVVYKFSFKVEVFVEFGEKEYCRSVYSVYKGFFVDFKVVVFEKVVKEVIEGVWIINGGIYIVWMGFYEVFVF